MTAARQRVVTNTMLRPDKTPIVGKTVRIQLNNPAAGWESNQVTEITTRAAAVTDATGTWSVTLDVNADIEDGNSYYTVAQASGEIWAFTVPAAANGVDPTIAIQLRPLIVSAPGSTPGLVVAGASQAYVDAADALRVPLAQRGAANGVATLGSDSKVPRNQLPNISGSFWQTVANQASMLALAAPDPDTLLVVFRADTPGYIWFLNPGLSPATLGNWQNVQEDAAGAAAAVQTNLAAEAAAARAAESAAQATANAAAVKANNLSDLADMGTARANLHVPVLTSCQAVAASNLTLAGTQTVDGYVAGVGDQILATAQTTASQNGPWVVAAGAWTRPTDYAHGAVVKGRSIQVNGGATYAGSMWGLSTTSSVTVDTNPSVWTVIGIGVFAQRGSYGVNVKDFAAKGDGTTDDYTAITAAIAYCAAHGGGTVYFPPGIYATGTTVVLPGGVHLVGSGIGGDIFQHDTNFATTYGTVLRAKSGCGDLLKTALFDTLTWTLISGGTTSGSAVVTGTGWLSGHVGNVVYGLGIPGGATVLSVVAGTSATLSANATITNTALDVWTGVYPTTSTTPSSYQVPRRFGLHHMVFDGGLYSGNASGLIAKIYGKAYVIEDVTFQNGVSGGVWSECWEPGGYEVASRWSNWEITNTAGELLHWLGPHDSQFLNGTVAGGYPGQSAVEGINMRSGANIGGEQFTNVHVWGAFTGRHWAIGTSNGYFSSCISDGGGIDLIGNNNVFEGTVYGTNTGGQYVVKLGDGKARTVTQNVTRLAVFNYKSSPFVVFAPNLVDSSNRLGAVGQLGGTINGATPRYIANGGIAILQTTVASTATTLLVNDASFLPASGTVTAADGTNATNSLAYTGKTATTLTGVTGLPAGGLNAGAGIYTTSDPFNHDTYELWDYNNSTAGGLNTDRATPISAGAHSALKIFTGTFQATDGLMVNTSKITSGSGAPSATGAAGDLYIRTGTPTVALQQLYMNTTGSTTWVPIGVAKTGSVTLVAGSATVADTLITANSIIRVASKTLGGTPGALYVSAKTAGTGYTISSTNAADTSVVQYDIVSY